MTLAGGLAASWSFAVHLVAVLVPLFVLGSFLVGLAEEYLPPRRVERLLRRYDGGSGNVLAAGLGAVTPFCSCSTVPVLAGLLSAGAPLGLAFSFLLASPLVNELAVVLLVGLFGVRVAVVYVVVTLAVAVVAGLLVGTTDLDRHLKDVALDVETAGAVTDGGTSACGLTGCDSGCDAPSAETHRDRVGRAARAALGFFGETLPYLVVGVAVGALVHGFVPTALVRAVIGPSNPFAVPIAAVAGAPIYVSMSAMLPVAASLADAGVPVGTVLAFVVGSAGVSVPNLVLLNRLFDRTLLAVYASTVVATGVAVGLLFNAAV